MFHGSRALLWKVKKFCRWLDGWPNSVNVIKCHQTVDPQTECYTYFTPMFKKSSESSTELGGSAAPAGRTGELQGGSRAVSRNPNKPEPSTAHQAHRTPWKRLVATPKGPEGDNEGSGTWNHPVHPGHLRVGVGRTVTPPPQKTCSPGTPEHGPIWK